MLLIGTPLQMLNHLREFKGTLPLPPALKAPEIDANKIDDIFRMSWVLKVSLLFLFLFLGRRRLFSTRSILIWPGCVQYTILLPDRGLVADNGFVV